MMLLMLALACAWSGAEGPNMNNDVFYVRSDADLGQPLLMAISERTHAEGTEPEHLEVVLAPGSYRGVALSVVDSRQSSTLSVTIRGAGPEPSILHKPINVSANTIVLQDLVVSGVSAPTSSASLKVGGSLTVERVNWVGNQREASGFDHPVVMVEGAYRSGAKSIAFKDCQFVDNATPGAVIGLRTVAPDIVEELTLDHVVFAGNEASVVLAPEFSRSVALNDVTAAHDGPLVLIRNPVTRVASTGGALHRKAEGPAFKLEGTDTSAFAEPELPGVAAGTPSATQLADLRAAALGGAGPVADPGAGWR